MSLIKLNSYKHACHRDIAHSLWTTVVASSWVYGLCHLVFFRVRVNDILTRGWSWIEYALLLFSFVLCFPFLFFFFFLASKCQYYLLIERGCIEKKHKT